jgi:DNA-binding response OmpR family regulator
MDGGARRFGKVEFDAASGMLLAGGKRVKLDRSSAAILAALVAEAPGNVEKDRLLELGWPGRVVHENSLAKAIGRLRDALGEDGAALETVHGYGYRLAVIPTTVVAPEPSGASGVRRRAVFAVTLGLAVIAAVSLTALFGEAPASDTPGLIRGEPADAIGRVLWVDDHPENNGIERRFLESHKVAVYQVATGEEALALLAMYEYRAVISDMNRHERPLAGLELVREMRRRKDTTPFILYTIVPSPEQRALLAEAGGQRATVTPEELYDAVLRLFGDGTAQGARATTNVPGRRTQPPA